MMAGGASHPARSVMLYTFYSILAKSSLTPSQRGRLSEMYSEIFKWSAVLVGVLFALWLVIRIARKSIEPEDSLAASLPFSLHDLREMHESGQISDEEFERARKKIIGRTKEGVGMAEAAQSQAAPRANPSENAALGELPDLGDAEEDGGFGDPGADDPDRELS